MRWFALFAAVVWTPLAAASEPESAVADRVSALGRIGGVRAGSLSPDGKSAAVSTALTGVPQIWTVPSHGGWPKQLTTFEDPAMSPLWSPRGDLIAFTVSPGGGLNTQIYVMRPDGSGLKRLTAGGEENNFLGEWTHDGRWLGVSTNAPGARTTESFLVDPRTGERQAVAVSEGLGSIADVTRDGKWALVDRASGRGNNDLYLVELSSRREVHLTPHQGTAEYTGQLGPDGRVFLQSDDGRDRVAFGELVLGPDRTPLRFRSLAERPDADVVEFQVEPGGRRALVLWNVAGRHELSWVDLKSGKAQRAPPLPAELAYKMRFSHDGRALLFTSFGPAMPLNAFLLDVATGKTRQLSEAPHPGVELSTLVRPELLEFQAHDGERLSGWLYLPKQFARPGPLVLSFHGGPEEQEYPSFRPDYQALLSAGIAVFAPNVRGSSGFGKRFLHLDDREKRVDAVRDIEAAWNAVIQPGIADAKRVGVMGASYGGYMTMAALTEYPDKFAAGATLCGIVNFETFFANTEGWMAAISTTEYGDPKTQPELLRRLSPIHKLDRIRAATLVMHGANDTNVPVIEAEQIVQTLKKRGVPVEYLLFPDEGHGWRKPANRMRSTVALVSFFSKSLGTAGAEKAASPPP